MKTRRKNIKDLSLAMIFLFSAGLGLSGAPLVQAGLAEHAVINEVHVDSIDGTGGFDDDWVELYNPTGTEINLGTWSIQKTDASGSSLSRQTLHGMIPAGGHFLIVRDGALTMPELKAMADILINDSFSLVDDKVLYLVDDNADISGAADDNVELRRPEQVQRLRKAMDVVDASLGFDPSV